MARVFAEEQTQSFASDAALQLVPSHLTHLVCMTGTFQRQIHALIPAASAPPLSVNRYGM